MNNIEKLVQLRQSEFELKMEISRMQELVIEEAILEGKKGILANVNGSKVALKMIPVKAKPTERSLLFQRYLADRKIELITFDPETKGLGAQIERLKLNVLSLQSCLTHKTNELICGDLQARYLEEQIKEEESNLVTGEFTPQLSVTLAK